MKELINKIKNKKELGGIPDSIVENLINRELRKNRLMLEKAKKSELKKIIKSVRAELRLYSGRFKISEKDMPYLVESGQTELLLKKHLSTKERLDYYPEIKKLMKNLNVKSVLDLGCGLNPIALSSKDVFYYASDIDLSNLEIVRKFFEKNNIKGKVFVHDLRNTEENLPEADICLLFKVLDIIENRGHNLAEKIIKKLKCEYVLASFPTRKISGKPMRNPERFWIERILKRLGFNYRTFRSSNEIFYLIYKD